jgi:hypothetical protein
MIETTQKSSYRNALKLLLEAANQIGYEVFAVSESAKTSDRDDRIVGFFVADKYRFDIEETSLYLDKQIYPIRDLNRKAEGEQ